MSGAIDDTCIRGVALLPDNLLVMTVIIDTQAFEDTH